MNSNGVIILTASNSGLTAGMIFGVIFFFAFAIMTIKGIVETVKQKEKKEKLESLPYIFVGIALCGVGIYITRLEYNILNNYEYVDGVTIDYCETGDPPHKAIEFEYTFNGKRYTNCNSYSPIKAIKVPGGRFKVRVSDFAPSIGRIDFDKPLTTDSKKY